MTKEIQMQRKLSVLVIILGGLAGAGACLFVAVQFVPTGVSTENPPVIAEPAWDSPQTRALAERACFDCHSNATQWPLYARVAPISWLVAHDVVEGRQALNFSEWGATDSRRADDEADGLGELAGHESEGSVEEVLEVLREGEMPPASYVLLHPSARLTPAEQQQLIAGFVKSLQ
jgi:hypothetical protein